MPERFVLCSQLRVLGSKHLSQQLHHLKPLIVIITLQRRHKERQREKYDAQKLAKLFRQSKSFTSRMQASILFYSVNCSDNKKQSQTKIRGRTRRRSKDEKESASQRDNKWGGIKNKRVKISQRIGEERERGNLWERDFIAAIILSRQQWSTLPVSS